MTRNSILRNLPGYFFLVSTAFILLVASPDTNAQPSVAIDAPDKVLIGETFKFTVEFSNAGATGYAPFVDVLLPAWGKDGNTSGGPCDGISNSVDAKMVGVNGGPITLKTYRQTANCVASSATFVHPYGAQVPPVSVPAGWQLLTIELPFGSFTSTQPTVSIEIEALVSDHADVDPTGGNAADLPIHARGGFRYGLTPLNEGLPDPVLYSAGGGGSIASAWATKKVVKPVVFIVKKSYLGPENEAATGPNFLTYYPSQYEITVNVANGQIVKELTVNDCLDDSAVFVGISPNSSPAGSPSVAGQCTSIDFSTIIGTLADKEVSVLLDFYVGEFWRKTEKPVLDPMSCKNVDSINKATADGFWVPKDTRDLNPTPVTDSAEASVTAKRIAIQKAVVVKSKTKDGLVDKNDLPIPGDYLEYKLRFQISDYFTFGELFVEDILSDGQEFQVKSATFRVTDKNGTTSGNFVDGDNLEAKKSPKVQCKNVNGGTRIGFQLSKAIATNAGGKPFHDSGIIVGGNENGTTSIPAEGEIVFLVKINDEFDFQGPKEKRFVDKEDLLNNCVTISGAVMENSDGNPKPLGFRCSDDSSTSTIIKPGVLTKEVVARNGDPIKASDGNPPRFAAGDTITFRITKTVPSGDWEDMVIKDWFPMPALTVSSLGTALPPCSSTFPAANNICYEAVDTVTLGQAPTVIKLNNDNSVTFDYGTRNDPANQQSVISILISLNFTTDPYADGLSFLNEARECESNTFGTTFCQIAVAPFVLTEPNLKVTKGVIATNNPFAVFENLPIMPSPLILNSGEIPPSTLLAPNFCLGSPPFGTCDAIWSPSVNSSMLATGFNADVKNVDANDWITYGVVIENRGSGLNGAFNVSLMDNSNIPVTPVVAAGLRAHDGNRNLLDRFGATPTGFPMTLKDPSPTTGSLERFSLTSGNNLAVVTYSYRLPPGLLTKIGTCYTNTSSLQSYTASATGGNFVTAGFGERLSDKAKACVNPTLTKSVVATSEAHTAPQVSTVPQTAANTPRVAIGEVVRYRLQVRIPEGTSSNFTVRDVLPAGMRYLAGSAKFRAVSAMNVSVVRAVPLMLPLGFWALGDETNVGSITPTVGMPASQVGDMSNCNAGGPVDFKLGGVRNNENDANQEFAVIEFAAVVCNVAGNSNGTTLKNTSAVIVDGQSFPNENDINVIVVEPNLQVSKRLTGPTLNGGTTSFEITVQNTSAVTAFDVEIGDQLPVGFVLSGPPSVVSTTGGCSPPTPNGTNGFTVAQMPAGCQVVVRYSAIVQGACGAERENIGFATFTSLPGLRGTSNATPGTSGATDGERNGTTPPLATNDYRRTGAAGFRIECIVVGPDGRLLVKKIVKNLPGYTAPASAQYVFNIACSGSGPNQTFTLTQANPSTTFGPMPAGTSCTVTEDPLPTTQDAVCPLVGWFPPIFSKPMPIVIPPGQTEIVEVENRYGCLAASSRNATGESLLRSGEEF